jgi:hypothetical protein
MRGLVRTFSAEELLQPAPLSPAGVPALMVMERAEERR